MSFGDDQLLTASRRHWRHTSKTTRPPRLTSTSLRINSQQQHARWIPIMPDPLAATRTITLVMITSLLKISDILLHEIHLKLAASILYFPYLGLTVASTLRNVMVVHPLRSIHPSWYVSQLVGCYRLMHHRRLLLFLRPKTDIRYSLSYYCVTFVNSSKILWYSTKSTSSYIAKILRLVQKVSPLVMLRIATILLSLS